MKVRGISVPRSTSSQEGRVRMAFDWDVAQGGWLAGRFAGRATRWEEKIEVAGPATLRRKLAEMEQREHRTEG